MADSQTKALVKEVYVKQQDGTFNTPTSLGATFENVIDQRASGATRYTLAQFLDNYLDFMKTNNFIAYGTNAPVNTHARIWIDTAHNNFDNIG